MDRQFGNYILHERVGIGGMGEVFRATKQGPDGFKVQVALKIILPHLADEGSFKERFSREAGLAASLKHPNIVQVTGFDILKGSPLGETPFIEMEYIPGADLRRVLRALDPGEKLPLEESAVILYSVASGLDHAHRYRDKGKEGIVHCDLNPHNILISELGEVKITDFGVARAIRGDTSASATVRGKLAYMSPEQMEGRDMDHRTDLFSFGIIAYQLLAGSHPFDRGSEGATITALGRSEHIPLSEAAPDLPPQLHDLVDRLLSLDPDTRPQSALSSIQALERMVGPSAVSSLAARIADLGHASAPGTGTFKEGAATSTTRPPTRASRMRPYIAMGAAIVSVIAAAFLVPTGLEPDSPDTVQPVRTGPMATARIPAAPEPPLPERRINIISEPSPARIFADGVYVADTPTVFTEDMIRSAQQFEARLYGYRNQSFRIPHQGAERHVVTLAPLPTGTVRISARPWAVVTFRGEEIGETPVIIENVPVGERSFLLVNRALDVERELIIGVREGINTVSEDMREGR